MSDNTKPVGGSLNQAFASLHEVEFTPQFMNEIKQKYGDKWKMMDLLNAVKGSIFSVKNRTFKVWERDDRSRTLKLGSQINTGSAGANISFTLDAGDYDSEGRTHVREYDSIFIPQASSTVLEYQIISKSGSAGAYTWTAKPFDSTATIATAVATGTELTIGANKHGEGSGLPQGYLYSMTTRQYVTAIAKNAFKFKGGQQAQERYMEVLTSNGQKKIFDYYVAQHEIDFNKKMDIDLWLGTLNSNSVTSTHTSDGTSTTVLSSQGYYRWLQANGGSLPYDGTWAPDRTYDIKDYLLSQSMNDTVVNIMGGTNFMRAFTEGNTNWVKEYSGGTDFTRIVNSMYGSEEKALSIGFRMLAIDGITAHVKEIESWSDPTGLGNSSLPFRDNFIVMPMGKSNVTLDGETMTLPYVSLGYLNNSGEDRRFVVGTIAGLTSGTGGRVTAGMAANQYDEQQLGMLSEYVLVVTEPNKQILGTKV